MVQIVATPDQLEMLAKSQGSVEIVDDHGNRVGFFARPFTDDDISLAKESLASSEPRLTTEEVLGHLRQLENDQ